MKPGTVLFLLAVAGHGPVATAQSTGTFTATGRMLTPRAGHTATLLPNGKVLIAGGSSTNTAELYNPSSGTFAPTASMSIPRAGHTATPLASGKVLIVGGADSSSAELYDPATETFSRTGDSITARRTGHIAALLNDGRVLIAGGTGRPPDLTLTSAELYDPTSGTFTATGSLLMPFPYGPATLLPSGKVLTDGSVDPLSGTIGTAEVYDPATGSFAHAATRLGQACIPTTGTLLTSGKVLEAMADAEDGFYCSEGAQLYDPLTGTFTATAHSVVGAATLLPDGTVLLGGYNGAELYDPAGGIFTSVGHISTIRGATSTLLSDGRVLVAGGQDMVDFSAQATAEIYRPAELIPPPMLLSVSGGEQGAILHGSTQQLVSPDNPAAAGEALEIYGAGLIDGSVIPPQVAVGGRLAEVLFFGDAPGYSGFNQVNVRVPTGVEPGSAVPVRLTYLGRSSNAVTIGVQ